MENGFNVQPTVENARLVHDAQRAVASNSKPSVPSKTGQWLQEVAHHGNTSKLSLQGCSNVQKHATEFGQGSNQTCIYPLDGWRSQESAIKTFIYT